MYFIDFVKSILKKHRIPVIIYFIINVCIISGVVKSLIGTQGIGGVMLAFVLSIGIYALSIAIALSPIGERLLRMQTGCKKIKRIDYAERLVPLFKEVYGRAKEENPNLPDDIELFMNEDKAPNAFALGRKTICLTRGMYEGATAEELKGVLAHEFAHIAKHDTDLILVVTVGNFIITSVVIIIRIIFRIMSIVGSVSNIISGDGDGVAITGVIGDMIVGALMWIWTKIGQWLVFATSRSEEYLADEFALKLGYAEGLCKFLDKYSSSHSKGVFAVLSSSHPSRDDRIANLQKMGSTYRA